MRPGVTTVISHRHWATNQLTNQHTPIPYFRRPINYIHAAIA
jgi:hypothetical protein